MLIAGVALGSVAERKQPDRHPRLIISRKGVFECKGVKIPVAIDNVSAGGCAIRPLEDGVTVDWRAGETEGRLWVEPMGTVIKRETLPLKIIQSQLTNGKLLYGGEFGDLKAEEYYVLADLMYADSDALQRFLATRRKHKNVFAGTGQFIYWGFVEPFRAFSYMRKQANDSKAGNAEAKPAEAPKVETTWLRKLIKLANKETPAPVAKPAAPAAKVA